MSYGRHGIGLFLLVTFGAGVTFKAHIEAEGTLGFRKLIIVLMERSGRSYTTIRAYKIKYTAVPYVNLNPVVRRNLDAAQQLTLDTYLAIKAIRHAWGGSQGMCHPTVGMMAEGHISSVPTKNGFPVSKIIQEIFTFPGNFHGNQDIDIRRPLHERER